MPPAIRHEPKRAKPSDSQYSVTEFLADFPDDATCLEHLWRSRFSPDGEHAECPKCEKERVFKRYNTKHGRQSWTCTGCGISAKQLERELGVHYKTAWRMFSKIRTELMKDEDLEQLQGTVEVDETSWGGRPRRKFKSKKKAAQFREAKTTVLGLVERKGRIRLRVVPSPRGEGFSRELRSHLNPSAFLMTDDWGAYKPLRREYDHGIINHSSGSYVNGNLHTNTIEGAFGNLKTGMRGTYKHVSDRWLQSYLDEYTWHYNQRMNGHKAMFHSLPSEATK